MFENLWVLPVFPVVALVLVLLFTMAPIPVGYDRGKIKWQSFCGTGMHWHTVYWTEDHGFQTLHPEDRSEDHDY